MPNIECLVKRTGERPPSNCKKIPVLEGEELWSFVFRRKDKVWLWSALNRETREIVASACGERSENTCRILWGRVPSAYKEAIVFSAYWSAYQAVSPSEQHRSVGKETGETAHIERWNNTLRQQLARFVRKTLSFSNCVEMHEICLKLFIHRSNTELLPIVGQISLQKLPLPGKLRMRGSVSLLTPSCKLQARKVCQN